MTYAPIGVVRPLRRRPRRDSGGQRSGHGCHCAESRVPGSLKSLDGFDYVWVLAHMHLQTENCNVQIKHVSGIRRLRAAARTASPISLSALKLVAVDEKAGLTVGAWICWMAPVLGVKPCVRVDAFPDARAGWVDGATFILRRRWHPPRVKHIVELLGQGNGSPMATKWS